MRANAIATIAAITLLSGPVAGQEIVLTNARIIDGTGQVIERGTVIVSDGRIASVMDQSVDTDGTAAIDLQGMTLMPGFIDTHRHDLLGDLQALPTLETDADVTAAIGAATPAKLQKLLDQGFTTVMMPGLFLSASLEVRRLLENGAIAGPRLLFSGPGFTAPNDFPVRGMVCRDNLYCAGKVAYEVTDSEVARRHVRALADTGVDAIKIFVDDAGEELTDAVLAAIVDEAKSSGKPTVIHAHGVADMLDAVDSGVNRLVHTPGDAAIAEGDGAQRLREAGVAIATTASLSSPQFAEAIGFPYSGQARHGQILENIRHLVDEGVVVAFGTDSPDMLSPFVEVELLSKVLAPDEIVAALTRNAAIFLGLEREIGTLEAGKTADIVIIDGDPLADVTALSRVVMVIQGGVVVVDFRGSADAKR